VSEQSVFKCFVSTEQHIKIKLSNVVQLSNLIWNLPLQDAATAAAVNELVTTQNSRHMLIGGY
jgi:hypothetical protein